MQNRCILIGGLTVFQPTVFDESSGGFVETKSGRPHLFLNITKCFFVPKRNHTGSIAGHCNQNKCKHTRCVQICMLPTFIRTIWFRLLPSSVVFIQPHIAEQHPPIALLLHFPSPEQQTLVAHDTADWLQSNSLPRPPLEIICTDVFLTFQPDEDWIVAHLYLNAFFLYITCLGYGNNAHQTSCFVQNRLSWNVIVLWEDFSSQTRFSIKACNTSKNKRKKKTTKTSHHNKCYFDDIFWNKRKICKAIKFILEVHNTGEHCNIILFALWKLGLEVH